MALQLIAGIDILKYANGEAFIKDGTDIKWKSKVLSIDNFVEVPEGYNKKERFQMMTMEAGRSSSSSAPVESMMLSARLPSS